MRNLIAVLMDIGLRLIEAATRRLPGNQSASRITRRPARRYARFENLEVRLPLTTISGQVWLDSNDNQQWESSEPAVHGWLVHVDVNANGQLDADEPTARTDAAGQFSFVGLNAGHHQIREALEDGQVKSIQASEATTALVDFPQTLATQATPWNASPFSEFDEAIIQQARENILQRDWAATLYRQEFLESSVAFFNSVSYRDLRQYVSEQTPLLSVPDPITGASPWGNWLLEDAGATLRSQSSGMRYDFDPFDTTEDWNPQAVLRSLRLMHAVLGDIQSEAGRPKDGLSRIEQAALATVVSNQLEYGIGPAILIERLSETFAGYRNNEVNNNRWHSTSSDYYGKIDGWKKHDGDILAPVLSAYGLLRDTRLFTDVQRAKIDSQLVQYSLDYFRAGYADTGLLGAFSLQDHGSVWNAMGRAAWIVDDQPMLSQLFDTYVTLFDSANPYFGSDGTFRISSSPNYHRQFMHGLENLGEVLTAAGAGDVFDETQVQQLRNAYTWMLRILSPLGTIPALNDSHQEMQLPLEMLERAAVHWRDADSIAWLRSHWGSGLTDGTKFSLFFRPETAYSETPTAPLDLGSEHLEDLGLMVLRDGLEGTQQTMVTLDYGGMETTNHRHSDYLNLGLWAQGIEMLTELGYVTTPSWAAAWQRSPLAHNTVQDTGFQSAKGQSVLWQQAAGVQIAEAGLPGRNARNVVLLPLQDTTAVVDIFRVSEGADSHTWALHAGTGDLSLNQLLLTPTDNVPFPFYSAEQALTDEAIHATWRFPTEQQLDLYMLSADGRRVTTAQMPPEEHYYNGVPYDVQPTELPGRGAIMVEQPGREGVFSSVLIPSSAGTAAVSVQPLVLENASEGTVGILVQQQAKVWIVIHTGDEQGTAQWGDMTLHGRLGIAKFTDHTLQSLTLSGGHTLSFQATTVLAPIAGGNAIWQGNVPFHALVLASKPIGFWAFEFPEEVGNGMVLPVDSQWLSAPWSFAVGVKPTAQSESFDTVFAKTTNWNDGVGLYFHRDRIWLYAAGTSTMVSAEIQVGDWSLVSGSFDGANLRLYINADLVASQATTVGPLTAIDSMTIGSTRGAYRWQGGIDELAIWDRVLTRDEVAELYIHTGQAIGQGWIRGSVFIDDNGDGRQQRWERGLPETVVFLDRNGNGRQDFDELSTVTNGQGQYGLLSPSGVQTISIIATPGWMLDERNQTVVVNVFSQQSTQDVNFALFQPATIEGEVGNDSNNDGEKDDAPLPEFPVRVYLDRNHDRLWNANEPSLEVAVGDAFTFTEVVPGKFAVRLQTTAQWIASDTLEPIVVAHGDTIRLPTLVGYRGASNTTATIGLEPTAYWPLSDAANFPSATDVGPLAIHGQWIGDQQTGPYVISGDARRSAALDGHSSSIVVADSPFLRASQFTFSSWLRPGVDIAEYANLLSKTSNWLDGVGLYYRGGRLHWYVNGNREASRISAAIHLDVWAHVAASYDGNTLQLYINGQLAAAKRYAGTLIHSRFALTIGGHRNAYQWKGEISEVAYWRSALSSHDIYQVYATASPSYVSMRSLQPLGYWPLDDRQTDDQARDAFSNDHPGFYQGQVEREQESQKLLSHESAARFGGGDVVVPSLAGHSFETVSIAARLLGNGSLKPWSVVVAQTSDWTDGLGLYYYGGKLWFYVDGTQSKASVPYTAATWMHIVGTYDGAMIRVFVDGKLAAQQPTSARIKAVSKPLHIGSANGNYAWEGLIDDLAVFETALNGPQIAALAAADSPLQYAVLAQQPEAVWRSGVVDQRQIPTPERSTEISIYARLKPTEAIAPWSTLISQTTDWTDGYGLYFYSGKIWFYVAGTSNHVSANISLAKTSSVTATYDGSQLRLYIDGQLRRSLAYAEGLDRVDRSVDWLSTKNHYRWTSDLETLATYSYALTPDQIMHLAMA